MSSHATRAFAEEPSAFRKSGGTACVIPADILCLDMPMENVSRAVQLQ